MGLIIIEDRLGSGERYSIRVLGLFDRGGGAPFTLVALLETLFIEDQ